MGSFVHPNQLCWRILRYQWVAVICVLYIHQSLQSLFWIWWLNYVNDLIVALLHLILHFDEYFFVNYSKTAHLESSFGLFVGFGEVLGQDVM